MRSVLIDKVELRLVRKFLLEDVQRDSTPDIQYLVTCKLADCLDDSMILVLDNKQMSRVQTALSEETPDACGGRVITFANTSTNIFILFSNWLGTLDIILNEAS